MCMSSLTCTSPEISQRVNSTQTSSAVIGLLEPLPFRSPKICDSVAFPHMHFCLRQNSTVKTKMDQIEERLAEEVRRYAHLYDTSSSKYKDTQMACKSWREIATNLGLEKSECLKRWKKIRDKLIRIRKVNSSKSSDPGGKKMPALCVFLSGLAPHIENRETYSNYVKKRSKYT